MSEAIFELDALNGKIEYCLNAFHKIKDENDSLRDRLLQVDKEILERDEKIGFLEESLKNKDIELQELVSKLEKILD
jgi:chromosome segregation ATPase